MWPFYNADETGVAYARSTTMHFIQNIFWNGEEHRLRAFWRLTGQLLILLMVLILVEAFMGCLLVGIMTAGEIGPADQLNPQNVQSFLTQNPILLMISTLALTPAMTLSVWLSGRFLDRRRFADFGFSLDGKWWADFGFGLFLGGFLMLVIFLIELAAGWVKVTDTFATRNPATGFLPAILMPLVTFLAVGYHEELFSRGYQLQNVAEGFKQLGPRVAIAIATILSSAVFGILHATNPNADLFSTLNITLAGVFLSTGYLLTGELAIPIGLHITWNFFQGNVFGFPVSGVDFRTATFIATEEIGPDLWTGGTFGPEAGLLGLVGIVLGIVLTILWVRWRYGEIRLDLDIAHRPAIETDEDG
jgi:hypothetical protein